MIKVGDTIPDATLMETTEFGEACPLAPKPVGVAEATKGKRVVVFGLPGAYTPTCSAKHLPGYLARLDAMKARGVDEVWCVSVNDGYVMAAWGREQGAIGKVRMLGDGSAELARKLGLDDDKTKSGMGIRCRRFSLLVDDGVVRQVNVEEGGKFAVSDADTMLAQLGWIPPMRVALSAGAWVDIEPAFVPAPEAERLFVAVRDELDWSAREIVIFGKRILQPRLVAWGGAPAYRYSGQTLPPRPLTPSVAALLGPVAARAGTPFNHVLANRYRDGQDSMGLHADDEPELGPDPVVATLSFGATRRFLLVPRRPRDGERRSFDLGSGNLLVMGGACQRQFRHGIPRDAKVSSERISLTFRFVK